MSTDLQKDLANAIIANKQLPRSKRKSKKELLVSVGFSEVTARSDPKRSLESKGVKDALRDFGLTEKLISEALVDDIVKKPKNRAKELRLGAEILGMKQEEKTPPGIQNNFFIFDDDQLRRIARRTIDGNPKSETESS